MRLRGRPIGVGDVMCVMSFFAIYRPDSVQTPCRTSNTSSLKAWTRMLKGAPTATSSLMKRRRSEPDAKARRIQGRKCRFRVARRRSSLQGKTTPKRRTMSPNTTPRPRRLNPPGRQPPSKRPKPLDLRRLRPRPCTSASAVGETSVRALRARVMPV